MANVKFIVFEADIIVDIRESSLRFSLISASARLTSSPRYSAYA
jgi:hypothetical protein